jgi:ABC-type amino acid transport substrate-binding protein
MAEPPTIEPGVLAVASAFPDPPFEVAIDGVDTGLDAELMELVCSRLGLRRRPVRYEGRDFNGIFDGLASRVYDAVISGTTITPEREKRALFTDAYLESGQSLVVNVERTPHARSVDDLAGLVVGIQVGNTSDAVARELEERGAIADIRYYPYSGITDALEDLSAGRIGAFIKLLPVMTWLTRDRPELAVVQEIPTHERLGIALAPDNVQLRDAVNRVLADLRTSGDLDLLTDRWLR